MAQDPNLLLGTQETPEQQSISLLDTKSLPAGSINPRHLAATTAQALGDLYYSDGTKFVRLPKGEDGQVLTQQTDGTVAWATPAAIPALPADGWITESHTLTYASANSITISGIDLTATYTKGTRIKFMNNSIQYYGVVASSTFSTDTTINLAPNADYSIDNSAITAPYYSYAYNPQGYPGWFNFATSWTGFSANPNANNGYIRFRVDGNMCTIDNMGAGNGTSNTNALTFTVPIAVAEVGGGNFFGAAVTFDNNAYQIYCGSFYLNGTTVNCYKNTNQVGGWTTSNSKMLYAFFSYPI